MESMEDLLEGFESVSVPPPVGGPYARPNDGVLQAGEAGMAPGPAPAPGSPGLSVSC